MKAGWAKLPRSEKLKAGDRAVYAGDSLGASIHSSEVGLLVAESGYFAVARKRKQRKKTP